MDKYIQIEIDHATSFRENVWSYPYFIFLDFSTLSRDSGLNSLYCQTLADLNRRLLISKHRWAEQPAASPSASCSQTEVANPRAVQSRQLRAGSVLQPIMWWFHKLWEQKLCYYDRGYLLSLLLNYAFSSYSPSTNHGVLLLLDPSEP